MISKCSNDCSNDLSRYYRFILIFIIFLTSCQAKLAAAPTPTVTVSLAATETQTATLVPTETQTPSPTTTPEPAWYQPLDPSYGVLKYQYAEVINERARVYASFEDAAGKTGNYGRLPNYPAYVAYTGSRMSDDARTFYQVNYGWMAAEDLRPLTPSTFTGILLKREVSFRFGWVLAETESVSAAGEPGRVYQRYQVVHEIPTSVQKPGYISVGDNEWLPEAAVALTSPQVPPDAGPNTCRFIYANLNTEILSVYDQCKLVFATLISSGKNSWTFEGRFAILYKVEYSSITPPEYSTSDYYIEGVPYFMTYAGNFGFHGAYWHDSFGAAGSHGCINLSPADAKWLYDWAVLGEPVIISPGK